MRININIKKSYFFVILAGILIIAGIFAAYAYNSNPANPSVFGHSINEIDGIPNCNAGQFLVHNIAGWSCVSVAVSANLSSVVTCSSFNLGQTTCALGAISSWTGCFLTSHREAGGQSETECTILQSSGNWQILARAGSSVSVVCAARCIK